VVSLDDALDCISDAAIPIAKIVSRSAQ